MNELMRMRISSGTPGYTIRAVPSDELKGNKNDNKVRRILTLGPYAWETLEWGHNDFYCKASDMEGKSNRKYFTVIKKSGSRPGLPSRARRHHRTYPYDIFSR